MALPVVISTRANSGGCTPKQGMLRQKIARYMAALRPITEVVRLRHFSLQGGSCSLQQGTAFGALPSVPAAPSKVG